jgi:2-dehydropantoate 2-reductase
MFERICIVGAGAIGGWIGARLAASGCAVSCLARGATLAALQARGLRLREQVAGQERESAYPVQASDDAAQLAELAGAPDLVVIALKAPALPQVAPRLAPLLGPRTAVLTLMNGVPWWFLHGFGGALEGRNIEAVDPGGAIGRAIDAPRVIGGVVHASCLVDAPGVVRRHAGNGLIVGEPSGVATPRLAALAALLARAGFETTASCQIQRDIWYKLWGNMTVNPVSALTGATADKLLDDELTRGFMSAVMLEAREIGARLGIPITDEPEDRHAITRKLGALKSSMLQDVEARKPVELDALVTAVRELGQRTGVATPFTDALLGLARVQARVLGLYPES